MPLFGLLGGAGNEHDVTDCTGGSSQFGLFPARYETAPWETRALAASFALNWCQLMRWSYGIFNNALQDRAGKEERKQTASTAPPH